MEGLLRGVCGSPGHLERPAVEFPLDFGEVDAGGGELGHCEVEEVGGFGDGVVAVGRLAEFTGFLDDLACKQIRAGEQFRGVGPCGWVGGDALEASGEFAEAPSLAEAGACA